MPSGLVSDPAASIRVSALIARYSGTSITALSPRAETLPMAMDHATAAVDPSTGVSAGTHDQVTHADVNVSSRDRSFCHTQAGRSTTPGTQGPSGRRPASTPASLLRRR